MVLSTAAALIAWSAIAGSAPPQIDTSTWKEFKANNKPVTIKAPAQWMPYNVNDAKFKAALQETRANNPQLASLNETAQSFDLYLLNMSPGGSDAGYFDNISIRVSDGGSAINSDSALNMVGETITKNLPSEKPLKYELVTLPAGRAIRYWGTLRIKANSKSSEVMKPEIIGYCLAKGGRLVVLTMATRNGNLPGMEKTFTEIAKSMRIN